jgi:hypothetical protein
MARFSFAMYQSYFGVAGNPVEWTDRYSLSDIPREQAMAARHAMEQHKFLHVNNRIADLTPAAENLPALILSLRPMSPATRRCSSILRPTHANL